MEDKSSFLIKSNDENNAILMVDTSGSVRGSFTTETIFDKFVSIINNLPHTNFHIVFWNSNVNISDMTDFPNGVRVHQYVIKNGISVKGIFNHVYPKIKNSCLTYPHLGFREISKWLDQGFSKTIYLITDGQIGYNRISYDELHVLKQNLVDEIKKIVINYTGIRLNIIAVESENRYFDKYESMDDVAGCDIFNIISKNKLTKIISKFISYTPNYINGYENINQVCVPTGYIPFRDQYFSRKNICEFIPYLIKVIYEIKDDENKLLKLVQDLSYSISFIVKDKPVHITSSIIRQFCELFRESSLDRLMIEYIFSDSIIDVSSGKASVFATYRSKLKELYKEANKKLLSSTKRSIGLGLESEFMCFPIYNKIIIGGVNLVDKPFRPTTKSMYKESCIKFDGKTIPIIPTKFEINNEIMAEQCLRQWIRAIIGFEHHINITSDNIIYIVMGKNLRIQLSKNISPEIKHGFQNMCQVMLRKKRLNTKDITEEKWLETGEFPTPNNGKEEDLITGLNMVAKDLQMISPVTGTEFRTMSIWFLLCLATGNKNIITHQFHHCEEDLNIDFKNICLAQSLNIFENYPEWCKYSSIPEIEEYRIPIENSLDYVCPITMEDVSSKGGYRFLSHKNNTMSTCRPIQVLSKEGFEMMTGDPTNSPICPICYTKLTLDCFVEIGPKITCDDKPIFSNDDKDIFFTEKRDLSTSVSPPCIPYHQPYIPKVPAVTVNKNNKHVKPVSLSHVKPVSLSTRIGKLVVLKGTIGSGKTTISKKIKKLVENRGGVCIVEGMDKYVVKGLSFKDGFDKINKSISMMISMQCDDKVIVIDTCGESFTKYNCFGHNLSNWDIISIYPNIDSRKTHLDTYLSWSLRNVLRRNSSNANSDFNINPCDAGTDICITVHLKKARKLFGKKFKAVINNTYNLSKDQLIDQLNEKANQHDKFLETFTTNLSKI